MKKIIILLFCLSLFNAGVILAGNTPKSIAGFTLGDVLSKYKDKIATNSTMCVRYQNYLTEVAVIHLPGYKTGLICVGNCADPGKIVRIKMKYRDPSKKFYDRLLKAYKIKFGDPLVWKGDAFGVIYAWKWSFTDAQGNTISLTLQHNSEDHEMKMGNSVKLTMTSASEKEKICYKAQEKAKLKRLPEPPPKQTQDVPDWDMLIPR